MDLFKGLKGENEELLGYARRQIEEAIATNAETLNLIDFGLTSLPGEIFLQLPSLRFFHCRFNHLSSIPSEIGNCHNLKELYVADNNLKTLPDELSFCQELEHVDIRCNMFESIPASLGGCEKLCTIYADNNLLPTSVLTNYGMVLNSFIEQLKTKVYTKSAGKN